MISLGVNSVLFRQFDFATAARRIAACGYDGLEISAIQGMCEHLQLGRWREQAAELRAVMAETGLRFLSMEVAGIGDEARLISAFEAGAELGIPVVNVGPGGKSGVPADLDASLARLAHLAAKAEPYGVTLCVKAHVGASVFDTPTTLRAMEAIPSPAFGIDMDPSHIFRAGERPEVAIRDVLPRVRHVHIRDYRSGQPGPGPVELQACGRGNIDLWGYCGALVEGGYDGPVCLEVIGAGPQHDLGQVCTVAAESYGYLNACLRRLGARG
jgi:sugar phosphate isomerase/epimerase